MTPKRETVADYLTRTCVKCAACDTSTFSQMMWCECETCRPQFLTEIDRAVENINPIEIERAINDETHLN